MLCESGVTRLVRRGDPHEVAKQALARLAQAGGRADHEGRFAEVQLQEAQFQRWLAEIRLHSEIHRARMAEEKSLEARGETPTAARILYDRNLREERQRVETWRNERVTIDLLDACRRPRPSEIEVSRISVDINTHAERPGDHRRQPDGAAHRPAEISSAMRSKRWRKTGRRATGRVHLGVGSSRPGPRALLDVEDNGLGVPPGVGSGSRGSVPAVLPP